MKQIKEIITWPTWCGKTYQAIIESYKLGRFIYLAPCRQLVYETWATYSQEWDYLSTWEIKINKEGGNFFWVFESGNQILLENYKTLIIDEAHFLTDKDRGGILYQLISKAQALGLNVKLLTATVNFKLTWFSLRKLAQRKKIVRKYRNLNNVSDLKWEKFLYFCRSKKDARMEKLCLEWQGYKVAALHSDITPSERVKIQRMFASGELDWVCCTNVLAQWINFPASAVVIPSTDWDYSSHTAETFKQIVGRCGRPGWSDKATIFYSWTSRKKKIKNKKASKKIKKADVSASDNSCLNTIRLRSRVLNKIIYDNKIDISWADFTFNRLINWFSLWKYSQIKYGISMIRAIASSKYKDLFIWIDKLIELIDEENRKTKEEIMLFRDKFNIFNK